MFDDKDDLTRALALAMVAPHEEIEKKFSKFMNLAFADTDLSYGLEDVLIVNWDSSEANTEYLLLILNAYRLGRVSGEIVIKPEAVETVYQQLRKSRIVNGRFLSKLQCRGGEFLLLTMILHTIWSGYISSEHLPPLDRQSFEDEVIRDLCQKVIIIESADDNID